jgi:hypothetical protein
MVAEFDAKAVTAEEIVSRAAGVTETPARGVAA